MFERILVPLDPTPHSEQVLGHVKRLLRREDSKVELLAVIVPLLEGKVEAGDRERLVSLRTGAARRRLDALIEELDSQGVQASGDVQMGDPADRILAKLESDPPSLVAMATHGRSGPVRWIRGSVAERVLRHSDVPVFLCNPEQEGEGAKAVRFRKILVPLDGSTTASEILPLAEEFARRYEAELVLCRVGVLAAAAVPYGEMVGPPILLPELEEGLRPLVDRLKAEGHKVSTHTSLGDPASEILAAVDRLDVDLIAMTTHGHSGVDRWLFGSVAENVLRHCRVPLLIKRVKAKAEARAAS